MTKVSRLKVDGSMLCLAHVLHLLLPTDSTTRVPVIMALLHKCIDIVNTLHFKAKMLVVEVITTNETMVLADLLDKISDIKAVLGADDQFSIEDDDEAEDSDDGSSINSAARKPHCGKFTVCGMRCR